MAALEAAKTSHPKAPAPKSTQARQTALNKTTSNINWPAKVTKATAASSMAAISMGLKIPTIEDIPKETSKAPTQHSPQKSATLSIMAWSNNGYDLHHGRLSKSRTGILIGRGGFWRPGTIVAYLGTVRIFRKLENESESNKHFPHELGIQLYDNGYSVCWGRA
ncbi:hypothetical protein B0O99DRAFT_688578 [Bisporella sp. PMI_857]|nr:hypothetical protein B0O99DRAFT_688578 [Bisporella sp. PMI_857]